MQQAPRQAPASFVPRGRHVNDFNFRTRVVNGNIGKEQILPPESKSGEISLPQGAAALFQAPREAETFPLQPGHGVRVGF